MNSYNRKVKCQNQNEGNCSQKWSNNTGRIVRVSRQTNTPPEFLVCSECQERFRAKFDLSSHPTVGDYSTGLNEYAKALSYINSCHNIINKMIIQNKDSYCQTKQLLTMPDLPNFIELFNSMHDFKKGFLPEDIQQLVPRDSSKPPSVNQDESPRFDDGQGDLTGDETDDHDYKQTSKKTCSPSKCMEGNKGGLKNIGGTHGKYLQLLPDVKQSEEYKKMEYVSQHNSCNSAPTTETEDSELDLIQQQQLVEKRNKLKSKINNQNVSERQNVIYEENDNHEESSRGNILCKQTQEQECYLKKNHSVNVSPGKQQKMQKYSNIPGRIKNPSAANNCRQANNNANTPRNQNVTFPNIQATSSTSTNTNQTVHKKIKPRSASGEKVTKNYSSIIAKKKGANEVNGNFSDTVIAVNCASKSCKKSDQKSLINPIGMGPSGQLSQRDLDKYAKELLGSGSVSPQSPRSNSPDSRNCSPKTQVRPKSENRPKVQNSKSSTAGPAAKQAECKRKQNQQQERQANNNNTSRSQQVQTQTFSQQNVSHQSPLHQGSPQQNACKRTRTCYSNMQQLKTLPEVQQTEEQTLRKQPNMGMSRSANNAFNQNMVANMPQSVVKSNISFTNSCPIQSPKILNEDLDPYPIQQRCRRVKTRGPHTHTEQEERSLSKSPCRSDAGCPQAATHLSTTVNISCRHRRSCSPPPANNATHSSAKAQYCVMSKPNDFFTVNRKCSIHKRKSIRVDQIYADGDDLNIESDDIKTDSDIEEDHFDAAENATEVTGKSSKSSLQMKKVLSNLGLFPSSGLVNPETEHMMHEAKSTRANDERNRPFREPRKSNVETEGCEQILRIAESETEVYTTASVTHLRRTPSEESSDIKSDNEDEYLRNSGGCAMNMQQARNVNYNLYQGNRYQT